MNKDDLVDDSCLERLFNAVESLLLCSDLSKGIESAFLSLIPLDHVSTPDDKSLVYNYLARIQRRLKSFAEAEAAVNFAILLQPKDANNYFVAARVAEDKGDLEAARQFAKKSLEVDPNYAEPAELLARL